MFGATCPAITCAWPQVNRITAEALKAGIEAESRQDSLGKDALIYWPTIASAG